jgi:hypothetical protein
VPDERNYSTLYTRHSGDVGDLNQAVGGGDAQEVADLQVQLLRESGLLNGERCLDLG